MPYVGLVLTQLDMKILRWLADQPAPVKQDLALQTLAGRAWTDLHKVPKPVVDSWEKLRKSEMISRKSGLWSITQDGLEIIKTSPVTAQAIAAVTGGVVIAQDRSLIEALINGVVKRDMIEAEIKPNHIQLVVTTGKHTYTMYLEPQGRVLSLGFYVDDTSREIKTCVAVDPKGVNCEAAANAVVSLFSALITRCETKPLSPAKLLPMILSSAGKRLESCQQVTAEIDPQLYKYLPDANGDQVNWNVLAKQEVYLYREEAGVLDRFGGKPFPLKTHIMRLTATDLNKTAKGRWVISESPDLKNVRTQHIDVPEKQTLLLVMVENHVVHGGKPWPYRTLTVYNSRNGGNLDPHNIRELCILKVQPLDA